MCLSLFLCVILRQALSEFSDLEALRKEKRAIMEEEQRLRALLSLEKVTKPYATAAITSRILLPYRMPLHPHCPIICHISCVWCVR